MKHCLIIWLLTLCSTAWVFSQGALREFVIEKDDNPQVFYRGKGCTPDVGVIVFYSAISDLKFSMPDTPGRLKNVSAYDKVNNCYVLCVQPTDTRIGGISQYSIAITGAGYKPMPAYMVSGITAGVAQYYKIKIEEDWKSAFESLQKEIAEMKEAVGGNQRNSATLFPNEVDQKPTFQGGDAEDTFRKWISENTSYPPIAQQHGISGRGVWQ